MDVGDVGGWSLWALDVRGYDYDGVYAAGFKGKTESNGKGKGDCYNGNSPGHFYKGRPCLLNGKSKRTVFQ